MLSVSTGKKAAAKRSC